MMQYARPSSVEDAVSLLSRDDYIIVAGATDIYPALLAPGPRGRFLDISHLPNLRAIKDCGAYWRIPALATWSELIAAPLPSLFDGLKQAAREVGGRQVQNAATICGNVCNASPAADGVPNLLTLDAEVELASVDGQRTMPIGDFIVGNRRTRRQRSELVTGIRVPKSSERVVSGFSKLGARRYLVISIAMVAAVFEVASDRRVARARIAVGACSPVAVRLSSLEADLAGRPFDSALHECVTEDHLGVLAPIDDVRATAEYRRAAARILVSRLVADLAAEA